MSDGDRKQEQIQSLERENQRLAKLLEAGGAQRGPAPTALLYTRIAELEADLERARAEVEAAQEQERIAEQNLRDVIESPSWQLTGPLRAFKRLLRRGG